MTTPRSHDERFTMVPDWLIESDLSLHDFAVLLVLMKHGRTTGRCNPGFATIARQARVSRDSVKRSLRSLEDRGLIEIDRRREGVKNLTNVYTLHVERDLVGRCSQHLGAQSTQGVTTGVGADSTQVGAHSTQGVGADSTPNETYFNESSERERVQRFAPHAHDGSARPISDEQFSLLKDWGILAGFGIPSDDTVRWMRSLTVEQFESVKHNWMRERDARGRGAAYDGPGAGDPEYEHLTARGKQWADVGCVPGEMR